MKNVSAHRIAVRALLIASAFVLSYLESLLPGFFPIPGIKLGLSNLVVLFALYRMSGKDAFFINMVRILLAALTFSNMFTFLYSVAGGILSYLAMVLLKKKTACSMRFVSIAGGVSHNIGQIITAMILLKNVHLLFYLPVLWISGIAAGAVIGLLCGLVVKRVNPDLLH